MCSRTTTPVVIVESHQHVLEHVHDVLRKKKIFDETWSMVHFDAHPDLACSKSAPAVSFFNPRHWFASGNNNSSDNDNDNDADGGDETDRGNTGVKENHMNLYELLDLTPSGIAEWILPLVLAAKLNKIEWVKPKFSSQISEGTYQFAVGVEYRSREDGNKNQSPDEVTSYLDLPGTARVKVDFNHPYYLDDLSVVSSSELVLKQNLELRVSELRSLSVRHQDQKVVSTFMDGGEKSNDHILEGKRRLWTLDICLDYFACQNPYLSDLENRNSLATRAFVNVMENSRFNINNSVHMTNDQPINGRNYQTEIIRFYDLLKQLLLDNLDEHKKRRLAIDKSTGAANSNISFDEISKYFPAAEQAERLIRQLTIEINDDDDSTKLSLMIIEAIPNWSMPHNSSRAATQKIDESLRLVDARIEQHLRDSSDPPFLVTIARSTLDGFCPPHVVETLQGKVLDILHRRICGESCKCCFGTDGSPSHGRACRLALVRDYGEWEGSVI
jgi:hypothetical protein